ncbi:hypothetical protein SAMN05421771_4084 [Granulicella pectinivorans]|jgi:hypothetical protein|uniref:Uncharacterized protein n=1 Tax=Granulicella pectinivorans TaxID=474950 RepID=A0A1I6MZY0_9BACT|nr:hypothetical protein SAMN05421771_4084 [Granulicella pectinivorans]
MDMTPRGDGRLVIALVLLAGLALLVWQTMDPGRFRYVAWLMLGFSAFRVLVLRFRPRYSGTGSTYRRLE